MWTAFGTGRLIYRSSPTSIDWEGEKSDDVFVLTYGYGGEQL
jgi:hypothetical protein